MRLPCIAAAFALLLAACAGGTAHAPYGAIPLDDPMFARANAVPAQLLDEEFAGTRLDRKRWYTCYDWTVPGQGCTNNGGLELEWYLAKNVAVGGGRLQLVAKAQMAKPHLPYTSGMIESGGTAHTPSTFSFLYGYAEMRAKFPQRCGHVACVLAAASQPHLAAGNRHHGMARRRSEGRHHRPCTGKTHKETISKAVRPSTPPPTSGRRITPMRVDWEPNAITWYLDGTVIKRFTQRRWIPNKPMYRPRSISPSADGRTVSSPRVRAAFPRRSPSTTSASGARNREARARCDLGRCALGAVRMRRRPERSREFGGPASGPVPQSVAAAPRLIFHDDSTERR